MRLASLLAGALLLAGCRFPSYTWGGAGLQRVPGPSPSETPAPACLNADGNPALSLPRPEVIATLNAASPPPPHPVLGNPSYFLRLPPKGTGTTPAQVLVALHGFGGNGTAFASRLVSAAGEHGWILVAPTFSYHGLADPVVTRADDLAVTQELVGLLRDLPARAGVPVRPRALLLGFSRGASMVERFALAHPEMVAGVAALSGGAYTLPQPCMEQGGVTRELPMPLGTADLPKSLGHPLDLTAFRALPFWLSVGADDDRPAQLPSVYDASVGTTRVARGQTFSRVLRDLDMQTVQLTVYPNTGHAATPAMVQDATAFLTQALAASPGAGQAQ